MIFQSRKKGKITNGLERNSIFKVIKGKTKRNRNAKREGKDRWKERARKMEREGKRKEKRRENVTFK